MIGHDFPRVQQLVGKQRLTASILTPPGNATPHCGGPIFPSERLLLPSLLKGRAIYRVKLLRPPALEEIVSWSYAVLLSPTLPWVKNASAMAVATIAGGCAAICIAARRKSECTWDPGRASLMLKWMDTIRRHWPPDPTSPASAVHPTTTSCVCRLGAALPPPNYCSWPGRLARSLEARALPGIVLSQHRDRVCWQPLNQAVGAT